MPLFFQEIAGLIFGIINHLLVLLDDRHSMGVKRTLASSMGPRTKVRDGLDGCRRLKVLYLEDHPI